VSDIILDVQDIVVGFPVLRGFLKRRVGTVHAVDGVSFTLARGRTLGLVGESGCGKTTVGNSIIRLVDPDAGHITFHGRDGERFAVEALDGSDLRSFRARAQMVFQDPYNSLNPRWTIGATLEAGLKIHSGLDADRRRARVAELLHDVGLSADFVERYPHELSGGQRQRVGIARALSVDPELVICDECVSALDVSVQAQIIHLLKDLQIRHQLAYIFISHDLAVVEYLSDEIAVMYLGQIVEHGDAETLIRHPSHPYTRQLLDAVPVARVQAKRDRALIQGEVPSPLAPPSGCRFHPRCPGAKPVCAAAPPPPVVTTDPCGHRRTTVCHFPLPTGGARRPPVDASLP
jgi:oligopeptide/dipeptide ABC transporter ATP-binding protein